MQAIQEFLRRLPLAIEVSLVNREERFQLIPTLAKEGYLQAVEVARHTSGFGLFVDSASALTGSEARQRVQEASQRFSENYLTFRYWLLDGIGV
ncbi:MAG: hypothetical protein AAF992_25555 [Bacteroidota bacterium]